MAQAPKTDPINGKEISALLKKYNKAKAAEQKAAEQANAIKEEIAALMTDADVIQISGMEVARVAPSVTHRWDDKALERLCYTLRQTENGELADTIWQNRKEGERAGYVRIAAVRPPKAPKAAE